MYWTSFSDIGESLGALFGLTWSSTLPTLMSRAVYVFTARGL